MIGYVLRFIDRARRKSNSKSLCLSSAELVLARQGFVKALQYHSFAKEIRLLKDSKPLPRDSKLAKLSPFVDDDGTLRVKGRLQLSQLDYDSKHPIILPHCHGSKLLVRYIHVSHNHAGVDSMIVLIRKEFEMFGLRRVSKEVKKECVQCQKNDVRACNEFPAPLPSCRVSKAPVFSVTGVDFAGPLFCLVHPGKKLYICLFVCGMVSAIHLELVDSLSSEDFLLAYRRFCALKRAPTIIYSDNGKNFVGGDKALSEYLGPSSPEWRFICPRSPWWGGWWERLVRSVKNSLKKTIGKRSLHYVELSTCLHEVAASVNSRPLTFVGADISTKTALSPNHFLAGQGNQGLESRVLEDPGNINEETLSLRHQEMIDRQNDFWVVWSDEYIRNLPPAFQKFRKEGNLEVGSMVLIREDNLPRMKWVMGRVERLHEGKDGLCRAADVKTSAGVKTRAIQRLYNLEIGHHELSSEESSTQDSESSVTCDQDPESSIHMAGSAPKPSHSRSGRAVKLPEKLQDYCLQ